MNLSFSKIKVIKELNCCNDSGGLGRLPGSQEKKLTIMFVCMNIRKILNHLAMPFTVSVLAVGLSLQSCSRQPIGTTGDGYGKVVFTLDSRACLTKASGSAAAAETAVNHWSVFVFEEGSVVGYGEKNSSGEIDLTLPTGEYQVCAVANYPKSGSYAFNPAEMGTLSQIRSFNLPLSVNSLDGFVMYGEGNLTVTEENDEPVHIFVQRLVAKVQVNCIESAFTNPLVYQRGAHLSGIGMSNVYGWNVFGADASVSAMSGNVSDWVNVMGVYDASYSSFLQDVISVDFTEAGQKYQTEHVFYVYPNALTESDDSRDTESWSKRRTRLLIKGTVGDTDRYWTLSLPGPVVRNRTYLIEKAILVTAGSLDGESGIEGDVDYDMSIIDIDVDGGEYVIDETS